MRLTIGMATAAQVAIMTRPPSLWSHASGIPMGLVWVVAPQAPNNESNPTNAATSCAPNNDARRVLVCTTAVVRSTPYQ